MSICVVGLTVAVGPVGLIVVVSVIVPWKLLMLVSVMVWVVLAPGWMFMVVDGAVSWKSVTASWSSVTCVIVPSLLNSVMV